MEPNENPAPTNIVELLQEVLKRQIEIGDNRQYALTTIVCSRMPPNMESSDDRPGPLVLEAWERLAKALFQKFRQLPDIAPRSFNILYDRSDVRTAFHKHKGYKGIEQIREMSELPPLLDGNESYHRTLSVLEAYVAFDDRIAAIREAIGGASLDALEKVVQRLEVSVPAFFKASFELGRAIEAVTKGKAED